MKRRSTPTLGNRLRGFIALCLFLVVVVFLSGCAKTFRLDVEPQSISANGADGSSVVLVKDWYDFRRPSIRILRGASLVNSSEVSPAELSVQSGLKAGEVVFEARLGKQRKEAILRLEPDVADSDKDGFPDVAELNTESDRRIFREWFVTVAESQRIAPSNGWKPDQRDCAGLVRFAYREALKEHNTRNLRKFTALDRIPAGDIRKFNYPDVPIIGERIFRTAPGVFDPGKTKYDFSNFASARVLQEHNTFYVGKDINRALPGDLLFFLHFENISMPYHTMVFGRPDENGVQWLIYHTGPVNDTTGVLKRISMDQLIRWKDDRWHPTDDNPYFLGVYRFRILG